jgi:hypothetical protein
MSIRQVWRPGRFLLLGLVGVGVTGADCALSGNSMLLPGFVSQATVVTQPSFVRTPVVTPPEVLPSVIEPLTIIPGPLPVIPQPLPLVTSNGFMRVKDPQ